MSDFCCVCNYNLGFPYKAIGMLDQHVMEVLLTEGHLKIKGLNTKKYYNELSIAT